MAIEKAKIYLTELNLKDRILEFDSSSATVELAALAVGCEAARIAKTLSFLVEESPILIVVAGDAKVDNSKYKLNFGKKAKMISADQVEELVGHAVGGVCPFGIHEGVDVYLDISLKRFDTVYPACGSSNSAVRLSILELETSAQNVKGWVDVCREWGNTDGQ